MEFQLAGRHPLLRRHLQIVRVGLDELLIDAQRLQFASPLDLAAMAAMARCYAADGSAVTLRLPRDLAVTSYLQRMDLLAHMPEGTRIDGSPPDEVRTNCSMTLLEVSLLTEESESGISSRLGTIIKANFAEPVARQVFQGIGELIDNATSHGSSATGAYIAAQFYSGRTTGVPRLEVAVCDTGIGVLNHLRQNPEHAGLSTSAEALTRALEPNVTGTGADEKRGNGLPDLLRYTGEVGVSRLVMRSGDGLTRIGRRRARSSTQYQLTTSSRVQGTWAWVRVSFPR